MGEKYIRFTKNWGKAMKYTSKRYLLSSFSSLIEIFQVNFQELTLFVTPKDQRMLKPKGNNNWGIGYLLCPSNTTNT